MICVTGGAGSIGSEVVARLNHAGESVRVLDISEEGLWATKAGMPDVEVMLGDVQSIEDCERGLDGCSDVIHCAALKHVDLCETNPMLANRVNVLGTHNVLSCAARHKCPAVFVSTDKASTARGIMGLTKLQAERIASGFGASIVRFGNVLGTRGSLIPVVLRYAGAGRPIPVTDPDMTRFFMSIEEAVGLIFTAMEAARDGHPRMFTPANPRSARIGQFVHICRDMFAPGHPIEVVGARRGEAQHEQLPDANGRDMWSNDIRALMEPTEILAMLQRAGLVYEVVTH